MAKIVHLQHGAPLPSDANFVLVKSGSSGGFDIMVWTGHPRKTTIKYENVSPISCAIQRAKEQADQLGISVVYVQVD